MNLILNLPDGLEAVIKKRAADIGVDLQTFVVDTLAESVADELLPPQPLQDFVARLDRIVELHKNAPGSFDDSRESIYLGCGE